VISGSANPDAMTCAAPKRDAPAALQLPANFAQASQKTLVRMAIFHGSGVNSRSCPFQQSQKKTKERSSKKKRWFFQDRHLLLRHSWLPAEIFSFHSILTP